MKQPPKHIKDIRGRKPDKGRRSEMSQRAENFMNENGFSFRLQAGVYHVEGEVELDGATLTWYHVPTGTWGHGMKSLANMIRPKTGKKKAA